MELDIKLMLWKLFVKMSLFHQLSIHIDNLLPPLSASQLTRRQAKILTSKGWIYGKCKGFPFLNYSKCIWDLNKVKHSHNCHWLKRVAQGWVSNGAERVPFWKSQTSPWGCVLQSESPGTDVHTLTSPVPQTAQTWTQGKHIQKQIHSGRAIPRGGTSQLQLSLVQRC